MSAQEVYEERVALRERQKAAQEQGREMEVALAETEFLLSVASDE